MKTLNLLDARPGFFDEKLKETVSIQPGIHIVETIQNPDPSQKGFCWYKIISQGYVFALDEENAKKLALL